MVLDTSALLALLFDEPEAEDFRAAVEEDTTRLVSAAVRERPCSDRRVLCALLYLPPSLMQNTYVFVAMNNRSLAATGVV